MADYNIQLNWAGKDSLNDTDPDKIIAGADFQTEFNAVKSAVNGKAEENGGSGIAFNTSTLTANSNIVGQTNITAGNGGTGSLKWGASGANVVGTNAVGNKTISTSAATGGADKDVWYQV